MALGIINDHEFRDKQLTLEPGDFLFLFTNGITEACNRSQREFGEPRLDKALTGGSHNSMSDMVDSVLQTLKSFTVGMEPFDDVTCLALRWTQVKAED